MNLIKNLHLLEGFKQEDLDMMEHAALQHKRYANITFKIIAFEKKTVTIEVRQGKSAAQNYQTGKRLHEIVHETFGRFFKGIKMNIGTQPFRESPANNVNAGWISRKMEEKKIKLKHLAEDTGVEYTQLSALISGTRPLSQPMKALFWYYFQCQDQLVSQGEGSGKSS